MAKNSLIMSYVVRKNKNPNSLVNGKWFAFVKSRGVLSTRGLAEHMIGHGLVSNKGDVLAFLAKLSECIPELVAQGYSVKLDSIGIFYPTIANNGKKAPTDVADFNIAESVKGVRFRFKPDSTDLDDLTTKTFGKRVSFGDGYYQTAKGPKAPKIPLAAYEPQP